MSELLEMWTVYDHPLDNPDLWVARAWAVGPGGALFVGQEMIGFADLHILRQALAAKGLVPIPRSQDDDPKIVETWL